MTAPRPPDAAQRTQQNGAQPTPFGSTPNAERYLLEADNLRRRQLRSALMHGSSRTWRDRRRIWPAVIGGIVLAAIISAAIAISGTFQSQQRQRDQEEREREEEQRQLEEQQQQREEEFEQQRRERDGETGPADQDGQEGQAITGVPGDVPWRQLTPLEL